MEKQKPTDSLVIKRRSELMAELFLQELGPIFVAKPTSDISFDLLTGFLNSKSGINVFAVEVKTTQENPNKGYTIRSDLYRKLCLSNIPVLFLVIDVKANAVHYAWPDPLLANEAEDRKIVKISVVQVTPGEREKLKARLEGDVERPEFLRVPKEISPLSKARTNMFDENSPQRSAETIYMLSKQELMAGTLRATEKFFSFSGVNLSIRIRTDQFGTVLKEGSSLSVDRFTEAQTIPSLMVTIFIHKDATTHEARFLIACEIYRLLNALDRFLASGKKSWPVLSMDSNLQSKCEIFALHLLLTYDKFYSLPENIQSFRLEDFDSSVKTRRDFAKRPPGMTEKMDEGDD